MEYNEIFGSSNTIRACEKVFVADTLPLLELDKTWTGRDPLTRWSTAAMEQD
jgi:hypothetical protein